MKTTTPVKTEQLYKAVWRWHFYAGIYVLPFLFLLSLSGLLMLLTKPIEPLFHETLMVVKPAGNRLPASDLLATVEDQYPHSAVKLYMPPTEVGESARFSVVSVGHLGHGGHGQPSTTVYVNPYNGEILGDLDPENSIYALLKNFHSSLFLGDVGDGLIEIAAGLAILMTFTGLYMAWPTDGWRALLPRLVLATREDWRRLHRITGLLIAIPLVFFLISGLAWTNVWGGKLVQPWSSLPGASFDAPKAENTHQSMNQHGVHQVPWAMEQTPLPLSGNGDGELNLDSAIHIANLQGFTTYRVHLPQTDSAVWTLSATTIAGDIINPLAERTIHLDRFSGEVLADLQFAAYPAMGQAMATFIPFHQGDLGLWNWLLNVVMVLLILAMLASGFILWWKRRSKGQVKLASPPAKADLTKVVGVVMLVVALCFPLSAMAIMMVILLDWLLIARIKKLQHLLK